MVEKTEKICGACEAEKKYGGVSALHSCEKKTQRSHAMDEGNKNEQLLRNFVIYCNKHPEKEFYQALRDWSKYRFIYGSMREINLKNKDWLEDTLHTEKQGSKIIL